nr:hypothetical protein [Rhodoferax sp.]
MRTEVMTDQGIYDCATDVIYSIVGDLSKGIYAELGGNLTFSWSTKPLVSAWAESAGDPFCPPQHRVVICYELARRFYRDAEDYHQFAASELFEDRIQGFFRDYDPNPRLPGHIDKMASVRNMFIGSLTWVFFHEVGHLMQEHGYIRALFGSNETTTPIEDCESDGKQTLEGRAAVIAHVTEFAADVEATQWCVEELARHFLFTEGNLEEQSLQDFRSTLFLLVCGISCAFCRFYGQRSVEPEQVPASSHPTPNRRLEVCLPNIFEKLDFGGRGKELHGLSRSQLVYLCGGAAYSAGFFWHWSYAQQSGIPDNFMPKGLLQDKFIKKYWSAIVLAWDEMEPTINKIRRFGSSLGMLSFNSEFRSKIFDHP